MYCEKCKIHFESGERCPDCNSKKVRKIKDDDICFVTEINVVLSGILEEIYKQNNIPYMVKGRLGAALTLTLGTCIETTCFFVPYVFLEKASSLAEEVFNSSPAEESEIIEDYEEYLINEE